MSSLDSASTTTGLCMVEAGIFGLDDAHPSTSDLGFEFWDWGFGIWDLGFEV